VDTTSQGSMLFQGTTFIVLILNVKKYRNLRVNSRVLWPGGTDLNSKLISFESVMEIREIMKNIMPVLTCLKVLKTTNIIL
jgi:hypothetical protein